MNHEGISVFHSTVTRDPVSDSHRQYGSLIGLVVLCQTRSLYGAFTPLVTESCDSVSDCVLCNGRLCGALDLVTDAALESCAVTDRMTLCWGDCEVQSLIV